MPEATLSPVERAARDWRREVLADLGGLETVPAAKVALLDAATGTKIILDSIDRYVFELATAGGLVSRRTRTAFRVVADRMRVADGLARQLQALGLEHRQPKALDLGTYLAERYQSVPEAPGPRPGAEADRDHGPPPAAPSGALGSTETVMAAPEGGGGASIPPVAPATLQPPASAPEAPQT